MHAPYPPRLDRHRWVQYSKKFKFDASAVPAEWHMWLHRISNDPPNQEEVEGPVYHRDHKGNTTFFEAAKHLPPGHFLNAKHKNPINAMKIVPWTPDADAQIDKGDTIERKQTNE